MDMSDGTAADDGLWPALRGLRVADAMHPGLVSCPLDAPLRTVARVMATYRVHAVLVAAHGDAALPDNAVWGVVSDADLLRAARAGELDRKTARESAGTPVHVVAASDALTDAAQLMSDAGLSHLVVIEPASRRPVGMLSTLDLARALAAFPERHPVAS